MHIFKIYIKGETDILELKSHFDRNCCIEKLKSLIIIKITTRRPMIVDALVLLAMALKYIQKAFALGAKAERSGKAKACLINSLN
ncbi:hypothetical protein BpHYR1_010432 [Brachionus plicatilis]|uniref:Uncharacterized protein n=1 Tax=Brachionus plicatilis TaxID=10195 RepID=A0A3M7PJB0_BRAPC|nr:hypothetical protein BpHYR1_010432 [Brachionus plicatilis]